MNIELTFVLIGTTHTGNIGAAARAMKTMGYASLRLVDTCSHRTDEAKARASGATDVLSNAEKFENLEAAVADCHAVVGTSARPRHLAVPMLSSRELAATLAKMGTGFVKDDAAPEKSLRVALVFGRERSGLNNHELDRCTHLVQIPVNPEFSSLNLGSAVQVLAYECSAGRFDLRDTLADAQLGDPSAIKSDSSLTSKESSKESSKDRPAGDQNPSDSAAMERLFEHFERVMLTTGFLDPKNPKHLLRRLRHFFERNRPTGAEMNILRGFLTSIERPCPPRHDNPAEDE